MSTSQRYILESVISFDSIITEVKSIIRKTYHENAMGCDSELCKLRANIIAEKSAIDFLAKNRSNCTFESQIKIESYIKTLETKLEYDLTNALTLTEDTSPHKKKNAEIRKKIQKLRTDQKKKSSREARNRIQVSINTLRRQLRENTIDDLAHTAATSPHNDLPEPSQASKESGNYKKGHLSFQGLSIAIENPTGSIRSGVGKDGKKWRSVLKCHYGYIKKTLGNDGDHVDIYIGTDHETDNVVLINQSNEEGGFDEHKVCLGFPTFVEGVKGYLANYEKGWNSIHSAHQMTMKEFKDWLKNGNTKKPYKGNKV